MLRKTVRVVFILLVFVAAIWVYLKVVAEPLVRDINLCKRESKELKYQLTQLEQSRVDVAEMKTAEHGRLDASRRMLRKRLVPEGSVSRHVERVLPALRMRARSLGLQVQALRDTPMDDAQRNRVDLPLTGTRMRLISARIRGSAWQWGLFLEATSRLPAYLTLSSVQGRMENNVEMRVEWILHHISGQEPLPHVPAELLNSASSLLERPIPPLDPGRVRDPGGR
ncbi:MAG TPA: hypothetical protein ENN40_01825 [Candidatus Aminicenantes bacterium]|nr:hypothetical protein [Candidatus Aminicenantes bacterium]